MAGISIAVVIHSLDPLQCRRGEASCSIDIAGISIAVVIHSLDPLECGNPVRRLLQTLRISILLVINSFDPRRGF